MGASLSSPYWPSLILGYVFMFFHMKAISRKDRLPFALFASIGGAIGYMSTDASASQLVFKPEIWLR